MKSDFPITCGPEAISNLIEFCRYRQFDRFLLIADQNTYTALGRHVQASLHGQAWDVRTAILNTKEVLADERHIFDVLFRADGQQRVYLAVGSGTITDITRYASFCARNPFISLPTAPSVDAYASGGAALVMGGFKLTVPGHAPVAIFAHLPTLRKAPRDMIAAGFGDVLGKYTSLADWQLGALLIDEDYNAEVAARAERALRDCVEMAPKIGRASEKGIATLMEGLFESGLCMMAFGNSRPASGSEHLLSHYWEIQGLQLDHPAHLHGAKVGVGTVLAARRYEALRSLTRREAIDRLACARLPSQEEELAQIRRIYGRVADRIVANHQPFLEMLEARWASLQQRIGDHWPEIQEIAARVPTAQEIADLLAQAGAPAEPQGLGLNEEQVRRALKFSRYLRARFTVNTLGRLLALW